MNGMLFLCYELTVNQLIIWYTFKVRKNDLQKLIQVDKYIFKYSFDKRLSGLQFFKYLVKKLV